MGKGSRCRISNRKLWGESYDRIYGVRYARNSSQEDTEKSENYVAGGTLHDQKKHTSD